MLLPERVEATRRSRLGAREESLASVARAAELDPRSVIVAANYSSMLMIAGRNADAIAACTPALEHAPDFIPCLANRALAYLLDGKRDLARPFYDRWARSRGAGTDRQVTELFEVLAGRDDRHAFARKLAVTPDRSWNDPNSGNLMSSVDIPSLLVLLDEKELALRYIDAQPAGTNTAWC